MTRYPQELRDLTPDVVALRAPAMPRLMDGCLRPGWRASLSFLSLFVLAATVVMYAAWQVSSAFLVGRYAVVPVSFQVLVWTYVLAEGRRQLWVLGQHPVGPELDTREVPRAVARYRG